MRDYDKILKYIDNNPYIWSCYIIDQLKEETTLKLLSQIIKKSNKEPGEAVMILLSTIRYLTKDKNALSRLQEFDLFQEFIKNNFNSILRIAVGKRVQANLPERAFPLLEVLDKKIKDSPTAVIELGASYGLIGYCLLNPCTILEKKDKYFSVEQKVPMNKMFQSKLSKNSHKESNSRNHYNACNYHTSDYIERNYTADNYHVDHYSANYYLGIEIDPPEREWLLSCISEVNNRVHVERFLDDIHPDDRYKLLKGSAFGFSKLKPVTRLSSQFCTLIILTSFMFYQYNDKKQNRLKYEINEFMNKFNAHWINQAVDVHAASDSTSESTSDSDPGKYFIEWDGDRIIELMDDRCLNWKWIE